MQIGRDLSLQSNNITIKNTARNQKMLQYWAIKPKKEHFFKRYLLLIQ